MTSQPSTIQGRDLGLHPGQILDGQFVIDKLIGAGGQGMVFKVTHLEWNQDFALKLPLPEMVKSEKARNRFIKEAETWIRMGVHPNVVRCWFVRPVAGLPGLFLDLVTGGSLEDRINDGSVKPGQWETITLILLQIVEGLTHSHAKGVVHRDLKPENLMVDASGAICITDFGLVKTLKDVELKGVLDAPLPESSTITEGQMGTPRYGAPEQWMDPESISVATDLYSFGAIMFELLCGQRPFEPPGAPADPLTLINKHIDEEPPDPRSLRPDMPAELAELCLKCMRKDPAERPKSAVEVLESLKESLSSACGKVYHRPLPVPGGDRPDLLNNAATSLFLLGRSAKARELLLKGLMIEAGHPRCLFNLVQLDRREGKIDRAESFRRLARAKAHLELALLYLEEGLGSKASEHLGRLEDSRRSGYIYRIEGDALMYSGRYSAAAEAYIKARELMPNDIPSEFRMGLAEGRARYQEGRIYFPSLKSIFSSRAHDSEVELLLSDNGEHILGLSATEVLALSVRRNTLAGRGTRPPEASKVLRGYCAEHRLVIQDETGFEIWCLKSLSLSSRQNGQVLAASSDLSKLVLLTSQGVVFFDTVQSAQATLQFPPDVKPSRHVLASFNPAENGIGILSPDGRIASVQGQNVAPLPWPPAFPNPSAIGRFALGLNRVAIVTREGVVESLDLAEQKALYRRELGFRPSRVTYDASGTILVLSSSQAFTVLGPGGELLLRGPGPFEMDRERTLGLAWRQGVLKLFQLHPFHLNRSWTEKIAQPRRLRFSGSGSHALTFDSEGQYRVWEVDEKNRVYERSLLVTPGASYKELIRSYETYLEAFREAGRLFEKGLFHESYLALQVARAVPGFQQAEKALDLQWELCGKLRRGGLDAAWERLYIPDTISSQLSPDSRHLLIVAKGGFELFHLSGPRITKKLSLSSESALVAGSFLDKGASAASVLVLTAEGALERYEVESGELVSRDLLHQGRVLWSKMDARILMLLTDKRELLSRDLSAGKELSRVSLGKRAFESAFQLSSNRALVVTKRELLMLEQGKSTLTPGLPLTLERLPGSITYVGDLPQFQLRCTGFSDGTLIISNLKTGEPLLGINQENGPVSGACLNVESALGVSVSSAGGITLFGLDSGRILERFVAHSDGVAELTITEDGRYITTRSVKGQFRLWEVSWELTDTLGSRKIDWLPSSGGLAKLGRLFRR